MATPAQNTPTTGNTGAPSAMGSNNNGGHQHHPSRPDASSLEITYSTISPKVEQPPYPMYIKLNLIDQHALNSNLTNGSESSPCESPYPMTPLTPGGSTDLSKKQRHNLREQRRILRISNQFDILRNKLEGVGYSSSKKDKYSVLQATLDYITQLERNQQSNDGSGGGGTPLPHTRHGGSSSGPPLPVPGRLSITAPSPSAMDKQQQQQQQQQHGGNTFMIDSMPSPVPALSMPGIQSFPLDLESPMFGGGNNNNTQQFPVDAIEGSTASYKDVFFNSSMPSLLAKLDGTIVEANGLFLELCCKNIDELRLHSLYTMCTAGDAPKMYSLVQKILSCEMVSAQSKMLWHFSNSGDRKVFVSVSMIHDSMHRPANLHCSLLPLS